MPRSPRGHFLRAMEIRSIVEAPSILHYRKEPPAPVKCEHSNEYLHYCVDIAVLVEKCDRSGYMAAFLSGMRWESIPEKFRGKVAADIRKFRRELKDGGYAID